MKDSCNYNGVLVQVLARISLKEADIVVTWELLVNWDILLSKN